MIDEHDEYLWTKAAPVSPDVAALERQLRPLAWTPRELPLPASPTAPVVETRKQREIRPAANDTRWWAPVVAGLAAAAAVFGVILWLRAPEPAPPSNDASPQPSVQPTGRPAPDLKDPFAGQEPSPSYPTPSSVSPDLKDPFGNSPATPPRRKVSPDLKDPFANSASTSPAPPAPDKRPPSPDLGDPVKDPFKGGDSRDTSRNSGKLYDPFTGKPADTPKQVSPDLKDPFKR